MQLPEATEWDVAGNYAENLRPAVIAGREGCVPTGRARTVLADAGARTEALSGGSMLTVGADGRALALDGRAAGTLGADFRAVLADGDGAIVFTAGGGREWVSGGSLQGAAPGAPDVTLAATAPGQRLTAEVTPVSPLKGTYNRMTEPLQAVDRAAMVAPVEAALRSVRTQALLRGMLTQPAWVGWQMRDTGGRIVARGEPQRFGALQGDAPLQFRAPKSGTTFSPTGSATLAVEAYGLTVSVGRSDSAFWRGRVRELEVVMWADCMRVSGTTGRLTELDAAASTLTVTPQLEETAREGAGVVAARIERPLEGVAMTLFLSDAGAGVEAAAGEEPFTPVAVYAGGSIVAYALEDVRGGIGIARSDDPLRLTARARVSRGEIVRICAPVGSGGGWNYARHHLLVFATDGIYAVSVDSGLTRISSTAVCGEGIARADAVAVAPAAVYAATSRGSLLSLTGTRVRAVASPLTPVAVVWSAPFGELWVMNADGRLAALTASGRASMRTLFRAVRFVEPAMAVGISGTLLDLADEEAAVMPIVWRRRVPDASGALERRVIWTIDTARAAGLTLAVLADGGGTPQRVVELTVNGPVNAPLTARFRAPRRAFLTAAVHGLTAPPSRLVAVAIR